MPDFIRAIDPEGPFFKACVLFWLYLTPLSAGVAIVAAAFCPFKRTVKPARFLSLTGFWIGAIAYFAAIVLALVTETMPSEPGVLITPDGFTYIFLTVAAMALNLLSERFCRRRIAVQCLPLAQQTV